MNTKALANISTYSSTFKTTQLGCFMYAIQII